jgi:Endosomal/lysosomal potassium channel TMEM175
MHQHAKYDKLGFRLRGAEINRLEAFSDVVFGFALTLLVVSLEVPHTYNELIHDLRGFLPFAACFALLVQVWYIHYKFFRRYGMEDALTVTLNAILLFVVLFYVYPLKFVFSLVLNGADMQRRYGPAFVRDADAPVMMMIYGAGFASVFLIFLVLHARAYHQRELLALTPLELYDTRTSILEDSVLSGVGIVSLVLAYILPPNRQAIPGLSYMSIPVFMTIIGRVRGKARKRFIGTEHTSNASAS